MPYPVYRRAAVLGLLIAVGAFAIDLYIPGFAAIARDLHTDPGTVQLSMTSFFAALAIGQIVYGPVSDAVGGGAPRLAGGRRARSARLRRRAAARRWRRRLAR